MTEIEELLRLGEYAFHRPVTGGRSAFEKLLEFAKPYTHWEGEQLSSMLIDLPFEIYWGQATCKMAGIGYVASYPEFRGQGHIRELFRTVLRENYEAGTALSYLAPFSYNFYRQFGYEAVFDQKVYRLRAVDFPSGTRAEGAVCRVSLTEDLLDLMAVHQQAYNQGSAKRTAIQWEYYFAYKSQPYFALYTEAGQPLGYLIYEFQDSDFVIRELITLTVMAKQALYRFISSHAGAFEFIKWVAPANARLELDLAEPKRAEVLLKPYMMARIVNLDAFLTANGLPDFPVRIVDDLLHENNRVLGTGQPETMSVGAFTARLMRSRQPILREYF